MNEKSLKVLEQYEIQVTATRRGRGSYICETNLGKKLLADYIGSEKKLAFVNRVMEELEKKGCPYTDPVMANMEGRLISKDRDENGYVLKSWFEGRECDTKNMGDIEQAVKYLAYLHSLLKMPAGEEGLEEAFVGGNLALEIQRHNRELRKVYSFIRKRKQRNEFEILFLQYYSMFYEQALEAEEWLSGWDYGKLREEVLGEGSLCHGNFNQHNIIFLGRKQVFVSNFDRCRYDVQLGDLYQFLRKIMEKQDWDTWTGNRILEVYDREKTIHSQGRKYLYARLFYPEKFWKLANQYYNRSKSWIPWKSAGKLEVLIGQQKERNSFLKYLE